MSTNSDTWQSTIFINSPIHNTSQNTNCIANGKQLPIKKIEEQEEDTSSIVKMIPIDVSL